MPTTDTTLILRLLLGKAATWGYPIAITVLYVLTAFDQLVHEFLRIAMGAREIPMEAAWALMLDY